MNGGGYIMRKKTVLGKWSTKPTSYDELFFFLYFSFVLFISTDNVRRQRAKLTADHHSGGTWCWSNNVLLWCLRAADCVESYLCEITPQWVYWMVIMITVTIYIYIYIEVVLNDIIPRVLTHTPRNVLMICLLCTVYRITSIRRQEK